MRSLLHKDISSSPTLWKAITSFFGFGRIYANYACIKVSANQSTELLEITNYQLTGLDKLLRRQYVLTGRYLERELYLYTARLKEINAYRAVRARQGLPSRGQRTHTNAKTAKRLRGAWEKTAYAKLMKKRRARSKSLDIDEFLGETDSDDEIFINNPGVNTFLKSKTKIYVKKTVKKKYKIIKKI